MTILHKLDIWHDEDVFQPSCSCGWEGEWESDRDNAEAEWHIHCDRLNPVVLG